MYKVLITTIFISFFSCMAQPQADQKEKVAYPIKKISDLSYQQGIEVHEKQKLDLFLPEGVKNPPLLLWIHGGVWAFGDRKEDADIGKRFAEEGIAVATISYRLSSALWTNPSKPEGIPHPAHIEDVASAFTWLHNHAKDYGYDVDRIFVSGYSAGGHLSALLALDHRYLHKLGKTIDEVRGFVPIAGAYDIVSYYQSHKNKVL